MENTLRLKAIQDQGRKMIEFSFNISRFLLKKKEVRTKVRKEKKEQFKLQKTR